VIEAVVELVSRAQRPIGVELDAQRSPARLPHNTTEYTVGATAGRVRAGALIVALSVVAACGSPPRPESHELDPTPQTLEEFQGTAAAILQDTGIPGAGIALVRDDDIEWVGGIGYADRAVHTPVTGDTHFRLGSISKTFVALAIVQLWENGLVDLDDTVEEIVPEVAIANPWHDTDPVRVIHLLQHTAGFDDMHFNERYVVDGVELPLVEVLDRNPRSRRVRWRPGTRMSYSNPGYAIAALVIERVAGEAYEDYIRREIFDPLAMHRSSFRLTIEDEPLLAQGYSGPTGPPVGFPQIHLRPAGNMHSSAREMGRFVQMMLNWGELDTDAVVDPEYLATMEQPSATLAASAGLRTGYASGLFTTLTLPYRVIGHGGAIDGFLSNFAYSPARDAGFVILVNSAAPRAGEGLDRLSSLAIRYLKRDVEPPAPPGMSVDAETLDQYTGYFHDANPRNQILWPLQYLLSGRTIARDADRLFERPVFGRHASLIPVTETMFRLENELDASRVFTTDEDGVMVMAGMAVYAERRARWRVEIVRIPILAAVPLLFSVFVVAIPWTARLGLARPRGFWELKIAMLLCPLALLAPVAALGLTPALHWGSRNTGTMTVLIASLAVPVLAAIVALFALGARREGASRALVAYALAVAAAMAGLTIYSSAHGVLGLRMWSY
jgi:CubicO group peptidase (beta-lactamase class C family)